MALALGAALILWKKVKRSIDTPLEYLGGTWSFKDSWVSNVTVAAGLLTGLFGSTEVVNAILGDETDSAVALATVGAAIAVALIASAPLILEATKVKVAAKVEAEAVPKGKVGPGKDYFSLGGLVAATVVALAAAFGELWF